MSTEAAVDWWVQLGYPPFDPGTENDQGYPDPGQVVKHFRQQKTVTREDGSRHICRQADLAHMLGVSESWVRAMELSNKGLDSISRRRALVLALNIPPILLGLAPLSDLLHTTGNRLEITATTFKWLNDSLAEAWELYYTSTPYNIKESVGRKIGYLDVFASIDSDENLRNQLLVLQCRFYHLAARISCDQTFYKDAYMYLKKATRIAEKLNNNELLAASYFWRGRAYLEEERFPAAAVALDKALSYTHSSASDQPTVPLALVGAILLEGGLAHAYVTASDQKPVPFREKQRILEMFNRAKSIVTQVVENDSHFIKLNMGRYHHFKAEALIVLGMPDDALRELDAADQYTSPRFTRRKAYINILRAQAALAMKDYPFAARFALEALNACKAIDSGVNIDFLKKICSALDESPYGSSDIVGKLRVSLMNV